MGRLSDDFRDARKSRFRRRRDVFVACQHTLGTSSRFSLHFVLSNTVTVCFPGLPGVLMVNLGAGAFEQKIGLRQGLKAKTERPNKYKPEG